ncbi:hypothetical protein RHSIM_Rhsim04G0104800 [Rhododendron simsii]|uniref:Uncharacterized protein n=1 Tax=Rhododendron simsii TaxID=118357 RepID=A0A834LPF5_RHOSS|nr:hypothetical protein RHSIM_Rhsim04G0104800 [Rhododendron simsii]
MSTTSMETSQPASSSQPPRLAVRTNWKLPDVVSRRANKGRRRRIRQQNGTYLDLLEKEMNSINKKVWAIGPLNSDTKGDKKKPNSCKHRCLEWLDKQSPKSVLYVSFGTTTAMADEQIKELAHGYVERVKEFGMVVRDWAPQVDILEHPSTGGFMSHCGWNSCLESITMGVPLLAWPMHSDQPRNAFMVTNVLKVGLAVTTWEQREQIVTSSTICKVVKMLMASRKGEEIRRKVEEIGGAARQAVKEGGVSCLELDSFITHITR